MLTDNRSGQKAQLASKRAAARGRTDTRPAAGQAALADLTSDAANGKHRSNVSYLNTRRRLMFVIEALSVGGAEHMVVDLANEFARRGDVVHVVCLSELGELSPRLSGDITLHLMNKGRGIDRTIPFRLRELIKKYRIQVVNSHLWTANLWTRLSLVRSGVPVVATEHNRDVWKRLHYRMLDRLLSRATARLIAVSADTADFYKTDVGIRSDLIVVVNNGVDTGKYASGQGGELRDSLARDDEMLIGTVGRLATAKNHPRLVEASGILRERGLRVRTVIVGEGPQRAETEAKITELNLQDRVTLLGERSDVPDLLAAFDVFVLSSDREGHPLSALEAQAAGTPVVLTDAGGSADAVSRNEDGYGGLLVDCTAEALAECLADLIEQPDKLSAMADFAKAYALQHFDKKMMIDRYSEIFDSVHRGL